MTSLEIESEATVVTEFVPAALLMKLAELAVSNVEHAKSVSSDIAEANLPQGELMPTIRPIPTL